MVKIWDESFKIKRQEGGQIKVKKKKSQSDIGIFSNVILTFESPDQTVNCFRLFLRYDEDSQRFLI